MLRDITSRHYRGKYRLYEEILAGSGLIHEFSYTLTLVPRGKGRWSPNINLKHICIHIRIQ